MFSWNLEILLKYKVNLRQRQGVVTGGRYEEECSPKLWSKTRDLIAQQGSRAFPKPLGTQRLEYVS